MLTQGHVSIIEAKGLRMLANVNLEVLKIHVGTKYVPKVPERFVAESIRDTAFAGKALCAQTATAVKVAASGPMNVLMTPNVFGRPHLIKIA